MELYMKLHDLTPVEISKKLSELAVRFAALNKQAINCDEGLIRDSKNGQKAVGFCRIDDESGWGLIGGENTWSR